MQQRGSMAVMLEMAVKPIKPYTPFARLPAGRAAGLLLGMLLVVTGAAAAEERKGLGLELRPQAVAQDTDLPAYPGAVVEPRKKDNTDSVTMGLWGFGFGFRLAVARYRSTDDAAAVADFYRAALARFGSVLDCSAPRPGLSQDRAKDRAKDEAKDDSKGPLTCGDDHAEAGGRLYKAGTRQRQHMVQIEPPAPGLTRFSLVALELQDSR